MWQRGTVTLTQLLWKVLKAANSEWEYIWCGYQFKHEIVCLCIIFCSIYVSETLQLFWSWVWTIWVWMYKQQQCRKRFELDPPRNYQSSFYPRDEEWNPARWRKVKGRCVKETRVRFHTHLYVSRAVWSLHADPDGPEKLVPAVRWLQQGERSF